jgi:hypothetical protein
VVLGTWYTGTSDSDSDRLGRIAGKSAVSSLECPHQSFPTIHLALDNKLREVPSRFSA